nr:homoserine dehydrogenase [Ameyamaea chiangmaiensis]
MRLGVAGLGTVGAGVATLLRANADLIAARAGRPIEIVAVAARSRGRDRGVDLSGVRWVDDARALAADPDVDVVVELIGAAEGVARDLVKAALEAGKPVVTANKALVAVHGADLARLSERAGVPLMFEAAVAGGIPVIKAVREGLAGDRLDWIGGILNGTCNYIMTTMRESGRDFADVLSEAQALGYAEADPSTDVDGIDAAHKLAILAALAFGRPVDFGSVVVEGIRGIGALDLQFAARLGYRLKLLGVARRHADGIETRVSPCLVPEGSQLASVEGVFNAVLVEGAFVGRLMLEGRGAGAGPTASAVVADLVDVARGTAVPVWGASDTALSASRSLPRESFVGAYYLRLLVRDQPGVIAEIAAILRDEVVSVRSLLQHGRAAGTGQEAAVPLVIVTHETREAAILAARTRISALDVVLEEPTMLRIEAG